MIALHPGILLLGFGLLLPLALQAPMLALGGLAIAGLAAASLLAIASPVAVLAGLVFVVAASPEHIAGGDATLQALVKLAALGAALLYGLRHGFNARPVWPLAAFVVLWGMGYLTPPLFPGLGLAEGLKSLIGFLVPFAFALCSFRGRDRNVLLLALALAAPFNAAGGFVFQALGIRSAWLVEYTGAWRLQGMNLSAYLAMQAVTGLFACLTEAVATGQRRWFGLAALNLVLVVGTGSRSPMAVSVVFATLTILLARGPSFGLRQKLRLVALGLLGVVLLGLAVAPQMARRFGNTVYGEELNLSGRDVLWTAFWNAFLDHPLTGQGIGTGKLLIDDVGYVGSGAAHNEYLRILVDAGAIGLGLLVASLLAWGVAGARGLDPARRGAMAAAGLAFALYSMTDNTLTATPAILVGLWLAVTFGSAARNRTV